MKAIRGPTRHHVVKASRFMWPKPQSATWSRRHDTFILGRMKRWRGERERAAAADRVPAESAAAERVAAEKVYQGCIRMYQYGFVINWYQTVSTLYHVCISTRYTYPDTDLIHADTCISL